MCTDDFAKSFIPFHVLTGCDANSCFSGHSKISLYEKLSKSTEARSLISKYREGLLLSDDVLNDLKSFVICYMYGDTLNFSLNLARATKWKRLKKKSSMCLLPDDDNLEQHIKCSNMLAYVQCHPDLRRHPSPIGHGWELANDCCRPVRHTNLPFQFHFQCHQCNRMAMTVNSELNLKLHMNLILILNPNHQMSWSHWMNLELDLTHYLYALHLIEQNS